MDQKINNMEKEFVPYELALRLKALGFDEPCFATFFSVGAWQIDCTEGALNFNYRTPGEYSILAPTFSQAFRWFRKNYRLSVNIHDCLDDFEAIITQWTLSDHKVVHEFPQRVDISYPHNRFDSYEEAELSCLVKLIEIVK